MAIKLLIFCGLLAVALGFTLPEEEFEIQSEWEPVQQPLDDVVLLVRKVRSPQGGFQARAEHHSRYGTSAGVDYVRPLGKNVEAYAGASRNFKHNDNQGHAGLRLRF